MPRAGSYCDFAPRHPLHGPYHDHEYGFPLAEDDALFERLILEINPAGLSWELMLKRRDSFRRGYDGFAVAKVARYGRREVARLLADPGVIRNRLKVEAAVANAKTIAAMRASHGGFAVWLAAHHPRPKPDWVRLFRQTFRFAGPEIVGEFLMSIGYLPGAHRPDCPVHARILELRPPWAAAKPRS